MLLERAYDSAVTARESLLSFLQDITDADLRGYLAKADIHLSKTTESLLKARRRNVELIAAGPRDMEPTPR